MTTSDGGTQLWTESAVIEAPIDQVAAYVLEVHAGPTGPDNAMLLHRDRPGSELVLEGGPTHYSGRLARLGGGGATRGGSARRPERDWSGGGGAQSRDVGAKWERIRYAESFNPKGKDYSRGGRGGKNRNFGAGAGSGQEYGGAGGGSAAAGGGASAGGGSGAGAGRGSGSGYDLPIIEIDVDRPQRRLIVQGHWWFRGEYRLLPHTNGTLLEYVAYNRAEVPNGLMRFLHRGLNRKQRNNLDSALKTIGNALGCRAYPVR